MSALFAAIALASAAPASVRCGAVERPGVAFKDLDGVWRGPAVELCAAAARAAFGQSVRVSFHGYETGLAEAGDDQIAFLSAAEIAASSVKGAMQAGPVMGYATQMLLVSRTSTLRRREELAGHLVCFIVGSAAEDALDKWAARQAVPIERLGFQEPDEMHDAFASGKCAAMAVDRAAEGSEAGSMSFNARQIDPPLEALPIFAATRAGADQAWGNVVARLVPVFSNRQR